MSLRATHHGGLGNYTVPLRGHPAPGLTLYNVTMVVVCISVPLTLCFFLCLYILGRIMYTRCCCRCMSRLVSPCYTRCAGITCSRYALCASYPVACCLCARAVALWDWLRRRACVTAAAGGTRPDHSA